MTLAYVGGKLYNIDKEYEMHFASERIAMSFVFPVFNISMTTVWLTAMIILLVVEASVPGLVSIWFALGAFAAMLSSLLNAPLWLQCTWFAVVSIASLWFTRPFVKKFVNSRTTPTNLDMVLGQDCVVLEDIDNLRGTGAVSVGGKEWTARMADAGTCAKKGEVVTALRIEGVKLIVEVKD